MDIVVDFMRERFGDFGYLGIHNGDGYRSISLTYGIDCDRSIIVFVEDAGVRVFGDPDRRVLYYYDVGFLDELCVIVESLI